MQYFSDRYDVVTFEKAPGPGPLKAHVTFRSRKTRVLIDAELYADNTKVWFVVPIEVKFQSAQQASSSLNDRFRLDFNRLARLDAMKTAVCRYFGLPSEYPRDINEGLFAYLTGTEWKR